MAQTAQIEVWVLVDDCGDVAVGTSLDDAKERYGETIQDLENVSGYRLVKVNVTVPVPAVEERSVTVPDGAEVEAALFQ